MDYIKVQTYKITIVKNGTFLREFDVIADSIEEAITLGKEIIEEGYDIGAITMGCRPCYKATSKIKSNSKTK